MSKLENLNPLFYPKAVAVIGATDNSFKHSNWYMRSILKRGFPKEHLYPINPNEERVLGLKAYSRVQDAPEPIDQAIVSVPKKVIKQIIKDCVEAKVKFAVIFTSGFSESDQEPEEGKKLEKELLEIISGSNTRIVGPNCMGVYSFEGGLSIPYMYNPPENGPVSFASQSGGHTVGLASMADFWANIQFNKIVSYGNGIDLEVTDYLEYFVEDPKTKIINLYVEGIKNGPRFFRTLREACKVKPVIVWKGGWTSGGSRATLSHTGSLAGSNQIWGTVFKQSGAIQVYSMEELYEVTLAFLRCRMPRGFNAAILGGGGGHAVVSTDECESGGLKIPAFSPKTKEKLSKIVPDIGTGIANPIDASYFVYNDMSMYSKLLEVVEKDPKIDIIILQHEAMNSERNDLLFNILKEAKPKLEKPFVMILNPSGGPIQYTPEMEAERLKLFKRYLNDNFLIYPSIYRASNAIYKMVQYYKFLERHGKSEKAPETVLKMA